jgi:hypothetical protein
MATTELLLFQEANSEINDVIGMIVSKLHTLQGKQVFRYQH